MDRLSSTRSPKAPARSWPPVEIDSDSDRGQLAPDRVLIQSTPVGYVCAGLGDPARLLRFAFERPRPSDASAKNENYETNPIFTAACERLDKAIAAGGIAEARRLGLKIPLGAIDDPALRRLAIAAALIKSRFDPDQPRDEDGRWTSGSGGGTAARGGSVISIPGNVDNGSASAVTPLNVSAPALAAGGTAAVAGAEALGLPGAGAGWSLWSEGPSFHRLVPFIVARAWLESHVP